MGRDRRHPAGAAWATRWLPVLLVLALLGSGVAAHRYDWGPRYLGWYGDDITTDPAAVFPGRGALLPLGSDRERSAHKGYGLGLLVELLTAVLAQGPTGPGVGNLTFRAGGGPPDVSHLVVVLDQVGDDIAAVRDDMLLEGATRQSVDRSALDASSGALLERCAAPGA